MLTNFQCRHAGCAERGRVFQRTCAEQIHVGCQSMSGYCRTCGHMGIWRGEVRERYEPGAKTLNWAVRHEFHVEEEN